MGTNISTTNRGISRMRLSSLSRRGCGWLVLWVTISLLTGCNYTLKGGTIRNAETFTIVRLENQAPLVVPSLAQDMTEKLRDKFLQQTKLKLTDRDGDLTFTGYISRYEVVPLTVQAGDQASQSRMSLSVHIKYVHKNLPEENWEQDFNNFVDFPAEQNAQAEVLYLPELVDKLVQDVFTKVLSNW